MPAAASSELMFPLQRQTLEYKTCKTNFEKQISTLNVPIQSLARCRSVGGVTRVTLLHNKWAGRPMCRGVLSAKTDICPSHPRLARVYDQTSCQRDVPNFRKCVTALVPPAGELSGK